jgi:hypothetical protein
MCGSVMRRWVLVVTISYRCPVSLGRYQPYQRPQGKGVSVPARTKTLLAWSLWLATLGCCAGGLLAALLWIRPLTLELLARARPRR